MSVDLGSGANMLTLNNGTNTGTVKDIGTLLGGSGTDTITLGTVAKNASISLGAGNDTLTFANGTNTATVANADTIIGPAATTPSRWAPISPAACTSTSAEARTS